MTSLTIRVDDDVKAALDAERREEERSYTPAIRRLLEAAAEEDAAWIAAALLEASNQDGNQE